MNATNNGATNKGAMPHPMLQIMPIVYVSDVIRAAKFYETLGFSGGVPDKAGMWWQMHMGEAQLGIHQAEMLTSGIGERIELTFVTLQPLEALVARLKDAGIPFEREITDEAFGRSIQIRDPDGLIIQINEH